MNKTIKRNSFSLKVLTPTYTDVRIKTTYRIFFADSGCGNLLDKTLLFTGAGVQVGLEFVDFVVQLDSSFTRERPKVI